MSALFILLWKPVIWPALAALGGVYIKGMIENRRFLPIQADRKKALYATKWVGTVHYTGKRKPVDKISFSFDRRLFRRWINPKLLSGSTKMTGADYHIRFQGGFYSADYLMLDYKNRSDEIRQFGTALKKLLPGSAAVNDRCA